MGIMSLQGRLHLCRVMQPLQRPGRHTHMITSSLPVWKHQVLLVLAATVGTGKLLLL